ncbi:DDE-type integrase/transposase/recombinase [Paraburkholderia bannensis]|uniref:DDE-type integrase/transposase/recombinase n=1 Tax=Paraburkholderia bannensis TaxID=765414 RepID=UPI0038BDECC0
MTVCRGWLSAHVARITPRAFVSGHRCARVGAASGARLGCSQDREAPAEPQSYVGSLVGHLHRDPAPSRDECRARECPARALAALRAGTNSLWQIDLKGDFQTLARGRCSPLTVIDAHSSINILPKACSRTTISVVQAELEQAFHSYGLPSRITTDNGALLVLAQHA